MSDSSRIVVQVSYSTAQIGELVRDFLSRAAISNIAVNVVGREVCLSGRMYDQKSIAQLKSRVESFVKDYPGIRAVVKVVFNAVAVPVKGFWSANC